MYTDPTGHWSLKKFLHNVVAGIAAGIAAVVTAPLGPTISGMFAGMAYGAVMGAFEGGWKGALIGAGVGAFVGANIGIGVNAFGPGFAYAALGAGVAYTAATEGWEGLGYMAGGMMGAVVGYQAAMGVRSAFAGGTGMAESTNSSTSKNLQKNTNSLDVDKGQTVTENTRMVGNKSTREWQVKDTVDMYKKYGSSQMQEEIQLFGSKGGTFRYNEGYSGTGQFFEKSNIIEFGTGNWEKPWSGYSVGRQGVERTLPHEIYHFTHNESYAVEEPLAHTYADQQREVLRQNRGW